MKQNSTKTLLKIVASKLNDLEPSKQFELSEEELFEIDQLSSTPNHSFSPQFNASIKEIREAISNSESHPVQIKKQRYKPLLAASILLITVATISIFTIQSNAVWESLKVFFEHPFSSYMEYQLTENQLQEYVSLAEDTNWKQIYFPTYLPDSFSLDEVYSSKYKCTYTFSHDEKVIIWSQQTLEQSLSMQIDNENVTKKELTILGMPAVMIKKEEQISCWFSNDSYLFHLSAKGISEGEIKKIAESVIPIKKEN